MYSAIYNRKKIDDLVDKELNALGQQLIEAVDFCQNGSAKEEDLQAATQYYEGPKSMLPFNSLKGVITVLRRISAMLAKMLAKMLVKQ